MNLRRQILVFLGCMIVANLIAIPIVVYFSLQSPAPFLVGLVCGSATTLIAISKGWFY